MLITSPRPRLIVSHEVPTPATTCEVLVVFTEPVESSGAVPIER